MLPSARRPPYLTTNGGGKSLKRIYAALTGMLVLCVFGCTAPTHPPRQDRAEPTATAHTQQPEPTPLPAVEQAPSPEPSKGPLQGNLLGLADDEQQAAEIAELYGITLTGFAEGVATFHTDEPPQTVIARGKQNGWPTLSENRPAHLFDS